MKYNGENVTMVGVVKPDDPAYMEGQEFHVVRQENGMEIYVPKDMLEDFQAPEEDEAQQGSEEGDKSPKPSSEKLDESMEAARNNGRMQDLHSGAEAQGDKKRNAEVGAGAEGGQPSSTLEEAGVAIEGQPNAETVPSTNKPQRGPRR